MTIPLKYAAGDLLYMLPQEPALSLSYDQGEGLVETGRIRDVFNLKFEKMYNALSRLSLALHRACRRLTAALVRRLLPPTPTGSREGYKLA